MLKDSNVVELHDTSEYLTHDRLRVVVKEKDDFFGTLFTLRCDLNGLWEKTGARARVTDIP